MKFARLSTTSKIYLLTLLLIFGVIFLNQSVFAQSPNAAKISISQERLDLLKRYQTWVNDGNYGTFKNDLGKKALNEFKSFLSRVILEDPVCLGETNKTRLLACREQLKFDYKLARKYNRYLKYQQIEEGQPNICVKADLGVEKAVLGRSLQNGVLTEASQVYLCTDSAGKKTLRTYNLSGALLPLAPEDAAKPELQLANIPPKKTLDILVKKLALLPPSGEIGASPNPCIIPKGAQTCGNVEVEWDVSDETSDPVEVKTKEGKFIEKSRNGSADVLDIGPSGETFILYSLSRKIGEVVVKAIVQ